MQRGAYGAIFRTPCPHVLSPLSQEEAPALVLQGLAAKMGPTFVKLAQTLRCGVGCGLLLHAAVQLNGWRAPGGSQAAPKAVHPSAVQVLAA